MASGNGKMQYSNLIRIDPNKRSGKPCVRDLRITVDDVLGYLAAGMSEAELIRDFPELTIADLRACLEYASDRERRFRVIPA